MSSNKFEFEDELEDDDLWREAGQWAEDTGSWGGRRFVGIEDWVRTRILLPVMIWAVLFVLLTAFAPYYAMYFLFPLVLVPWYFFLAGSPLGVVLLSWLPRMFGLNPIFEIPGRAYAWTVIATVMVSVVTVIGFLVPLGQLPGVIRTLVHLLLWISIISGFWLRLTTEKGRPERKVADAFAMAGIAGFLAMVVYAAVAFGSEPLETESFDFG